MTGSEARRLFLEYFKKHNHKIVRSSSLIPSDDPTLLFTNAGMVQFKRTFLGEEVRDYSQAATCQKCVRAGGKHNDLENVGYTARHHTFFEMLGNFSFGDYFKERAIEFAWDLLVNGFGLPEEKLWVSVYLDDDDSYNLWSKNTGIPDKRIIRLGDKDNFWSMGDTGPCGPCSEILIDRGSEYGCGSPDCKAGCDCDRYLEIWNLVFMQYNKDAAGNKTPLPRPSIDTGMGLERLVAVIQDVPTNYETDLILPIIKEVEDLSGRHLGGSSEDDVALKVIADHSRAAAFLIGDGVLPSNEGRGYVLRRIMRRAIRYGRNIDLSKPFLYKTAARVMDVMKEPYPELSEASSFITGVIKNEETRFSETLDNGLKLLNETLLEIKESGGTKIPGALVFKLYDTYGFPVDIVKDVIRDEKFSIDMEGFDAAMETQRLKSRSTTRFTGLSDAYKTLSANNITSKFVGYETDTCTSKILLIVEDGREVPDAASGQTVEIVTEATPFYGESGGQTGDTGKISCKVSCCQNFDMTVYDTVKDPTGLIIHKCKIILGLIAKGDTVTLSVDKPGRLKIACNHTVTHILHSVLQSVLGDHVKQAGSLVTPDKLRFDFSHFSQVEAKTLDEIEMQVNRRIRENVPVETMEMDAQEAFKSGATALFEEKYGERVRVVSLGSFSRELCGGTHAGYTGNIGLFKITGESSIASGVRRIEAVTGEAALEYTQKITAIVRETAGMIKEKPEAVTKRIEKILRDQRKLEKELHQVKSKIASGSADGFEDDIKVVNGVRVLAKKVPVDSPAALRELSDRFKDKIGSGIIVLGCVSGPKAFLVAQVTKDLTKLYKAGSIIKHVATEVGGGGGGRPDMAQAGGSKPENLENALNQVYELVNNMGNKEKG